MGNILNGTMWACEACCKNERSPFVPDWWAVVIAPAGPVAVCAECVATVFVAGGES